MKLLFSIKDLREARELEAVRFPHIVDVKNPEEGTLGANKPWVIKEVMEFIGGRAEIGASIGDLDYRPGLVAQAAFGVASLGVDYIVASMHSVKKIEEVAELSRAVNKAIEEAGSNARVIVSGYADFMRIDSVNPFEFPGAVEADILMLDTAIKDGKNIFDFATVENLAEFCDRSRENGSMCCISGSIRVKHLPKALKIGADILGFRGAICIKGEANREKVKELFDALESLGWRGD